MSATAGSSVFDVVGGEAFFVALVDRFYEGVAGDTRLRPLYPEADLTGAKHRLCGFLVQYWGGPSTYSETRGHPRLRMRHFPYRIGPEERTAWLGHMLPAVEQTLAEAVAIGVVAADFYDELRQRFYDYFEMAASHLENADQHQ